MCDASPYCDNYKFIKGVSIVHESTACNEPDTGQTYILVMYEALWMGNTLDHPLVNPNQLRHYGNQVQDNLMSESPLSIITEDGEFITEPSM